MKAYQCRHRQQKGSRGSRGRSPLYSTTHKPPVTLTEPHADAAHIGSLNSHHRFSTNLSHSLSLSLSLSLLSQNARDTHTEAYAHAAHIYSLYSHHRFSTNLSHSLSLSLSLSLVWL